MLNHILPSCLGTCVPPIPGIGMDIGIGIGMNLRLVSVLVPMSSSISMVSIPIPGILCVKIPGTGIGLIPLTSVSVWMF